jgi:hypothetical protein
MLYLPANAGVYTDPAHSRLIGDGWAMAGITGMSLSFSSFTLPTTIRFMTNFYLPANAGINACVFTQSKWVAKPIRNLPAEKK